MAGMPQLQDDPRIAEFLSDHADGVAPLATLLQQYNLSHQAIGDLVRIADRLRQTLVAIAPTDAFVEQLYQELVQQKYLNNRNWWARVPAAMPMKMPALLDLQHMSNRSRIAAGIGGITLVYLTARSLSYLLNLRQRDDTSDSMIA
jgi:hypothetical protein